MAAGKASIKVGQRVDFDRTDRHETCYAYTVKQTRNTTLHCIGDKLDKARIDELIQIGIDVTII